MVAYSLSDLATLQEAEADASRAKYFSALKAMIHAREMVQALDDAARGGESPACPIRVAAAETAWLYRAQQWAILSSKATDCILAEHADLLAVAETIKADMAAIELLTAQVAVSYA